MKFWTVVMVFVGVVGAENSDTSGKNDHNKDEHSRLCAVLKVAVNKWGEVHTREPTDPLRKALGRTIFGDEKGGDLGSLKGELPGGYKDVGGRRGTLCGQPREEDGYTTVHQPRWPGHSAPHDMVCLCTVGPGGWPLNVSENTLCGGDKETLRAGSGKGWGTVGIPSHHVEGKEQIQATWTNVTSECLQGGKEKGEELKDALNKFINTLVAKPSHAHPSRRQLGEGNPGEFYACTGSKTYGVCVMYYPNDKDTKTWWKDLQTAIKEDEEIQKQREEEEKRKQQEKVNDKDQPRAERLSATPTTTNQTEASKQDNLTDKLRRLNITSGTPISMPSSWLLRAVFLF